jgi:putative transcriptional regulator
MKKMSERDRIVQAMIDGMREIVAFEKGEHVEGVRITVIEPEFPADVRKKLKLNRPQFARLIGVSERTLEGWEQGRTKPTGAARSLLRVASRNPRAVLEALR